MHIITPHAVIRDVTDADLEALLDLADAKRRQYELYHPLFHRPVHGARDLQRPFFRQLLQSGDFELLVHETPGQVDGFIIGHLIQPPPVYDPGGLTCVVDDFAVKDPTDWPRAGRTLLDELRQRARARGAVQLIVVGNPQDAPKRDMLAAAGLTVASEWLVGEL